ncbi:ATPase family AAA domain-containing protein [Phanerochaete sordida]|uniref:ATPase family AAA domain-containing protein n=1 Tax=Phanerochaete sordida TaxID=48140 RepID=A0A9P3FWQ9_9APHY|nr:ATPase family AAA domain-containing protein [Phanerochaete sordida]
MRRFTSFRRANTFSGSPPDPEKSGVLPDMYAGTITPSHDAATETNGSTAALLSPSAPLPPPNLQVKRLDYYYSKWTRSWKYKNMGEKITPEPVKVGVVTNNTKNTDPWQSFCFVVVRTLSQDGGEPAFRVYIKSRYLRNACQNVIRTIPGISWYAEPLALDPQLLVTFLPLFEEYHADLEKKKSRSQEETYMMSSTAVLIEYLHRDYRATITSLKRLLAHGEITSDLLYAILIPRSIFYATCPITGEPVAVRLVNSTKLTCGDFTRYTLHCETIDVYDAPEPLQLPDGGDTMSIGPTGDGAPDAGRDAGYGWTERKIAIEPFDGVAKISELNCFPMKYHPLEAELRQSLIARGRKWAGYDGMHHVSYKGTSVSCTQDNWGKPVKYNVNCRVMIDRANFKRLNPNFAMPHIKRGVNGSPSAAAKDSHNQAVVVQSPFEQDEPAELLTDEELMLTTPVLYGFSLIDKLWLRFNVAKVSEIAWNDEAFENLVLPGGRKMLLRALVEAHRSDMGFDDFVKGKGHGLVVNLFGPPGVGKTLSAEATSEHVRSPLYIIGGADLGTSAGTLDSALQGVFDIATSWKAIVLIDEADVFLEQRSLHDLERNAMVAVFLRHLEYYRGILFLTTNRVRTFDEAFLSRIHVALHFRELTHDAKAQIWTAFLLKVGITVSDEQLALLAERKVNGREIKNATRTATSLAAGRGESLRYDHLVETLDAMEDFTSDFKALTAN